MVVNTKGQIVIPKEIRDKFGIQPGQIVEFQEIDGKVVLVKKGVREQFKALAKKYKFCFPKGMTSTNDFINEVRGR